MNLQSKAVCPELWTLLQRLMATELLKEFYLVGGTALALRYGHRVSVDLDLFTDQTFDAGSLAEVLAVEYGLTETTIEANTILGTINGIKVDCMAHRYPMVAGVDHVDGVRILAVEDIAAMKLNAIANRGSKKDFWDLHELAQHMDREHLLACYAKKYPTGNLWAVEKSLVYFEDAELEPDPICLKGLSWTEIRKSLAQWNRL